MSKRDFALCGFLPVYTGPELVCVLLRKFLINRYKTKKESETCGKIIKASDVSKLCRMVL